MPRRLSSGHGGVRPAHVEGHGVHRLQHRGGADHLGRAVDVLRGPEHRTDAVQDTRLGALDTLLYFPTSLLSTNMGF